MADHDKTTRWLLLAAGAMMISAFLGSAQPQDTEPSDHERALRGRVTYRLYCQNCHGQSGHGDGSIAELLKIPPADLTKLAADGDFPSDRVYEVIDGRVDVKGHGRREMPIWGIAFKDAGRNTDQEAEVRERILNLVAFLESIQAAADTAAETSER